MKRFNKTEYNKLYYKRNRKYILYRKKLLKSGQELPEIIKIPSQDGTTIIVFGDLILAKEIHHSTIKTR